MSSDDRELISRKTSIRYEFQCFLRGFSVIKATPAKGLFVVVYLVAVAIAGAWIHSVFSPADAFLAFVEGACFLPCGVIAIGGLFFVIAAIGTPRGSRRAYEALWTAGLTNHGGDAPLLLAKYKDAHNPRVTIWEFDPNKIPLEVWQTKQTSIEGALDITIAKMAWAMSALSSWAVSRGSWRLSVEESSGCMPSLPLAICPRCSPGRISICPERVLSLFWAKASPGL